MNRSSSSSKKVGNGHSSIKPANNTSTWKRAITAGSYWDDKDEFLDVIYWMRQVIALVLGITWGLLPIKGILGLFLFFSINCAIVYFYFSKYQNIDEEEYGGPLEIMKEGLFTAFSVFLNSFFSRYGRLLCQNKVSWIVVFTATQPSYL